MADTAASHIASERICHNEAECRGPVTGYLNADGYPGQFVAYVVATRDWALATSGTAAHALQRCGILGFKKRVTQSTANYIGTIRTIDMIWDVSQAEDKKVPIHLDGFCTGFITDQNAAVGVTTELILSGTAGSATINALAATGAGPTTGTAYRATVVATVARDIADDDTVAIVAIGSYMGQVYGDV